MSIADDPYYKQQVDNGYRAIGRYVVEFSQLQYHLRTLIAHRLPSDPATVAFLVLGEATAQQLANAFFGTCRAVADFSAEELKVEAWIRNRVNEQIRLRNDFAHGDWNLELARYGRVPIGTAQVIRIRPTRADGVIDGRDYSASDIDKLTDELIGVRDLMTEYGHICMQTVQAYKGLRVSDVLLLRGKNEAVVREGPKAPPEPRGL